MCLTSKEQKKDESSEEIKETRNKIEKSKVEDVNDTSKNDSETVEISAAAVTQETKEEDSSKKRKPEEEEEEERKEEASKKQKTEISATQSASKPLLFSSFASAAKSDPFSAAAKESNGTNKPSPFSFFQNQTAATTSSGFGGGTFGRSTASSILSSGETKESNANTETKSSSFSFFQNDASTASSSVSGSAIGTTTTSSGTISSTAATSSNNREIKKDIFQNNDKPIVTGEESENIILQVRAKLFSSTNNNSSWKEVGIGPLKILSHDHKYRIVQRRESHPNGMGTKLIFNEYLTKYTSVTKQSEKFIVLKLMKQDGIESWLWKFKLASDADLFEEKVKEIIDMHKD